MTYLVRDVKKMKKISVIIPVYNVEEYLNKCIDSVIDQKYTNLEIILVDDGSSDKSPQICDEYAEKYDFIKTIHKPNGGAADARNHGIRLATGEYILFIDSDDFIEENSINEISKMIENNDLDIIFLEAQKRFPDGSTEPLGAGISNYINGKSKAEVMRFLSTCPKFQGSACMLLLNSSIFKDPEMMFKPGIQAEDIDWCLKAYVGADTFAHCDTMYYNYRQGRIGSVTQSGKANLFLSLLYVIEKWEKKLNDYDEDTNRMIGSALAYEYPILLLLYTRLTSREQKQYKTRIKKLFYLSEYRNENKYKYLRLAYRIVGITILTKMIRLYQKYR